MADQNNLRTAALALENVAESSLDYRPEFRRALADLHVALHRAATPAVPVPALTRYGWAEAYIGDTSELVEDADGTYVKFADVQALLAASQSVPAPDAPPEQQKNFFNIVPTLTPEQESAAKMRICPDCKTATLHEVSKAHNMRFLQCGKCKDIVVLANDVSDDVGGLTEQQALPEGWRERLNEMREASYTISQYPETAQVVFDSVIDALDELQAEQHVSQHDSLVWLLAGLDAVQRDIATYLRTGDKSVLETANTMALATMEDAYAASRSRAEGGNTKPDSSNLAAPEATSEPGGSTQPIDGYQHDSYSAEHIANVLGIAPPAEGGATSEPADFVMPLYTPLPPLEWEEEATSEQDELTDPEQLIAAERSSKLAELFILTERINRIRSVESYVAATSEQMGGAQVAKAERTKPRGIVITLRQAEKLVEFFGRADASVTVCEPAPDWEQQMPGLYAYCTEYPEDGAQFLGATEVDCDLEKNRRDVKSRAAEGEATSERKPLTDATYRLLDTRDTIEKDDEWLGKDTVTWALNPSPLFVGMKYLSLMLPARRRVEQHHGIGSDK